ncbi:hypothetical protein V6R21_20615 [Limibacter armeniacum]|uniref:hypothetical protein n=1 Tax=Limibacter armeniacum TaxID=466084 RepID=UPI002FE65727
MKLGIGIFLVLLATFLYGIGKPKLLKEHNMAEIAAVTEGMKEGSTIFLHGEVSNDNKPLKETLVIGSKDHFTGFGKYNGFKSVEQYLQPVKLNAYGDSVTLLFEEVPYRGPEVTHILLEEKTSSDKPVQLKGITNGTQINILGKVKNESPLTVEVLYSFTGPEDTYLLFLQEGNQLMNYICIGLFVLGAFFLAWHYKSRKSH